jgi:uncharacterized protein YyaL (SSP411 family)
MSQTGVFTNHLGHETSPYLRQHAHNPVDWYPWGPEALARARQLDRPIFLSVGYSACHWCHVMEHESFQDEEVARLLNEHFVSIKVDREERPDLDQIYMTAVQLLTGQGGWPMSVFLTPDLRPFTGGTYFPPEDAYGRPGFKRVLRSVIDWWQTRRADINRAAAELTETLQEVGRLQPGEGELREDLIRDAVRGLGRAFDSDYGGFGAAPKFLHTMDLRLLLRAWARFGDDQALDIVKKTLDHMARGGIYDHLGGGFARYSTDAEWLVPHFEKMLYDNALLIPCYVEAFQATGDPFYQEIVEETAGWVLREMTSPQGPFYSTLDADSEGQEGKFYVWTQAEVEQALGKEDADLFSAVYDVQPKGNWEHGQNILHRVKTFAQLARLHRIEEAELRGRIDRCRKKLLEVRDKRVRPGLDDKALTSWNGLMIGALAVAGAVLDRPEYTAAARKAADFLWTHLRAADGRLLHTWTAGAPPRLNGYLEDYAYLLDGLVSLYQATFEPRWVQAARELARVMLEQFWEPAEDSFFYTGRDHEPLIARTQDAHDNATPSGNAMAVTGLLRLVQLTGQAELREKAAAALHSHRGLLAGNPLAAGQMLIALDFYLGPVQEVAIVGDPAAEDTRRVLRAARQGFHPRRILALKSLSADAQAVDEQVPLLAGKTAEGAVTTYVCRDFTCQAPLVGPQAAEAALGA